MLFNQLLCSGCLLFQAASESADGKIQEISLFASSAIAARIWGGKSLTLGICLCVLLDWNVINSSSFLPLSPSVLPREPFQSLWILRENFMLHGNLSTESVNDW